MILKRGISPGALWSEEYCNIKVFKEVAKSRNQDQEQNKNLSLSSLQQVNCIFFGVKTIFKLFTIQKREII